MATIAVVAKDLGSGWTFTWDGLGAGDDGAPIARLDLADRSFQIAGTLSGSTITLQGSNDGLTYETLSNPQGTPLTFTTLGIHAVDQLTQFIRPVRTGGTGAAAKVILFAKGKA